MAIHRTSDSLSRCDPSLYSNIYDVRKRPDIKHEPIFATQPTHKDTIEISRDKLKEEALNRLRHTSKYVIAHNGFMRIGKYLFLAVALPPYIMLYGLPKWILVEGLPAIFSMYMWIWKKVQEKSRKPLEAGARRGAQTVQFMRNIVQVLIQPVIRLALEIRHRIQRMREQTLQFFSRLNERAKSAFTRPFLKMSERFKLFQKRFSLIKEKVAEKTQTMATRLQEGIQWVKQSPQIIWNWGQIQFQKLINGPVGSWGVKWNKKFQASQDLAQRATNWISNQFKNRVDFFKLRFEPFISFYRQQILPPWHKLKEACKGKWQQTRHFFHQKHQRALAFLQKKQEKLKHLSYQHVLDYILSHVWMGKLPLYLQNWIKKWLSHRYVKSVGEKGVKAYTCLARGCLHLLNYFLKMLDQGMQLIFKLGALFQTYVRIGCQKVLAVLIIGQQVYRKLVLCILYYSLLCTVMAVILFIWGMRYLGNLMSSLTPKLSFNR